MTETQIEGNVYVCWKDPQKSHRKDLATYDAIDFYKSSGNPKLPIDTEKRPVLAYYAGGVRFLADDFVSVDLKDSGGGGNVHYSAAEGGSDAGVSRLQVPVTIYNKRTMVKAQPGMLRSGKGGDNGGGDYELGWITAAEVPAGSNDMETITAGVRAELADYQIPRGVELVLGHKNAFNSRVLLYLMTHS